MASGFSPWYRRFVYRWLPFLWKKCPDGNYHSRWGRSAHLCFCRCNEHSGDWHGGVMDLKTREEYIPYQEHSRVLNELHRLKLETFEREG